MDEELFEFESDRAFVMSGRGIVFVGRVREGFASVGDRVQVDEKGVHFVGMIQGIEHSRKLIDKTISGTELGLLLGNFSNTEVGEILSLASQGDLGPDSKFVQAEFAKRGIMFPVVLSLAPNGRHVGLWESMLKLIGLK